MQSGELRQRTGAGGRHDEAAERDDLPLLSRPQSAVDAADVGQYGIPAPLPAGTLGGIGKMPRTLATEMKPQLTAALDRSGLIWVGFCVFACCVGLVFLVESIAGRIPKYAPIPTGRPGFCFNTSTAAQLFLDPKTDDLVALADAAVADIYVISACNRTSRSPTIVVVAYFVLFRAYGAM